MVALVGVMSMASTWLLYRTALEEEGRILLSLVKHQAILASEMGWVGSEEFSRIAGSPDYRNRARFKRAHREFKHEGGEFIIGQRFGSKVRFLIANGQRVPEDSPMRSVPPESPYAEPMRLALSGQTGVIHGRDYDGHEVLAAYTPLFLESEALGVVGQIELEEIKEPFFRANFVIFSIGVLSTFVGLALFYRVSEPILQTIQRSEKEYRELVEGANNIIVRVDGGGRIIFMNRFARQFLADKPGIGIGSNADCLLGGDSPQGSKALKEMFKAFGNTEESIEFPLDVGPGRREWIDWTVRKIFENGEQFKELLCIGNVVTARHLARDAQREVEERFRGIAKASPVGIIITDMNANLLYANERLHSLTFASPSEMAGFGWMRMISPEDRLRIRRSWFQPMTADLSPMEFRIFHGDQEIWILGQIVELKNGQGDAVGYVITMTDISALKRAESEQKRLSAAIDQAAEAIFITDVKGGSLM